MNIFGTLYKLGIKLTTITGESEPLQIALPEKVYSMLWAEVSGLRMYGEDKYTFGSEILVRTHGCDVVVKLKEQKAMTDKPEKFYLVRESQLVELAKAWRDAPYLVPATAEEYTRHVEEDCRKIEVPEWATHFAQKFPACMKMEEIKR